MGPFDKGLMKKKVVKPHGILVLVSSNLAAFTLPAYRRCSLQRAFSFLTKKGYIIFGGAWRLDAFSAYPFLT